MFNRQRIEYLKIIHFLNILKKPHVWYYFDAKCLILHTILLYGWRSRKQ